MNKFVAYCTRPLLSVALAAACTSVLVVGAAGPANAAEVGTTAEWVNTVQQRLNSATREVLAVPAEQRRKAAAIVATEFDANGRFVGGKLARSTGSRWLDREAMRAVHAIDFPVLPASRLGKPQVVAVEVFFADPATSPIIDDVRAASHEILAKSRAEMENRGVNKNGDGGR